MSNETFEFQGEFLAEVERAIAKYPEGRKQSAVLTCLDQAQRQLHDHGHYVTEAAFEGISKLLEMPLIRVKEVASFFTMINTVPVGNHHIQLCGTTPCMLRGAKELRKAVEKHLGIENGETTVDGEFTLTEVECLGACSNAPMVQINDDFFEDLTEESLLTILDALKAGEPVKIGPQNGRRCSEPEGGPIVLLEGDFPQKSA
ncbi:complex I 24 kDa subunit family protein [Curvivirga aplysinae]|uniref:complex I 24 kDa subunit family protein n=1 Tax=Curvivirga aplysinae TaxID=2529852 RepID=UPI0012BC569C|nr:NAD(P)H-dependent oxidoreductase subunit E [Curvivirga aplysinae]MTI09347.1 NAD(P)H-dependent oxidoreductase subunit E [Curvivirga aplysinae]